MAGPIYKLWMAKSTEAGYQLSEEERNSHIAKLAEAQKKVGGKTVLECRVWSSEQWSWFGVEEYPDIEAVQKHTELLLEMGHYRYMESVSILGTKLPQS